MVARQSPDDIVDALSVSLSEPVSVGDVTAVYLAILRQDGPTRELLLAQGMDNADVDSALRLLAARGFITLDPGGTFEVIAPRTALPHHALDLERRANALRAAAHELEQIYRGGREHGNGPGGGLQPLHSPEEISSASSRVISEARERVICLHALTTRTLELLRTPLASQRRPAAGLSGHPVALQAVFDSRVLDQPDALRVLQARADGGERHRVCPDVPLGVVVADGATAVLDFSFSGSVGPVGLLVRARPLAQALRDLAERFWGLAGPVPSRPRRPGLTQRDTTILTLMASGVADATIARQVSVSQRTVERRVRALMDQLGAETRFQAGAQAAHRGWL